MRIYINKIIFKNTTTLSVFGTCFDVSNIIISQQNQQNYSFLFQLLIFSVFWSSTQHSVNCDRKPFANWNQNTLSSLSNVMANVVVYTLVNDQSLLSWKASEIAFTDDSSPGFYVQSMQTDSRNKQNDVLYFTTEFNVDKSISHFHHFSLYFAPFVL